MSLERSRPFRTVITGIDGAGKSTTAGFVVENLKDECRIVKPGPSRPVYSVVDGEKRYHYQRLIKTIDLLHSLADRSENPELVGVVNAINVTVNGRIIEPTLVRRLQPELVLGARDYYVDPAVYALVYKRTLAKKPMKERIEFLQKVTRVEFRDVIFFLTVPPDEAVERIEERIEREKSNPNASEREKWRHMHEEPETLTLLQHEYYAALKEVQKQAPIQVFEIDTSNFPQTQVVDLITNTIRQYLGGQCVDNNSWQNFNNSSFIFPLEMRHKLASPTK